MGHQRSEAIATSVQKQARGEEVSTRPAGSEAGEETHGRIERADLLRIAVVLAAVVLVRVRVWEPFAHFSLIGWTAMIVGGFPIFKEAAENIVTRGMTMELSMSIAIVAALAIGEAVTALIILLFVQVAEILEGLTVSR